VEQMTCGTGSRERGAMESCCCGGKERKGEGRERKGRRTMSFRDWVPLVGSTGTLNLGFGAWG